MSRCHQCPEAKLSLALYSCIDCGDTVCLEHVGVYHKPRGGWLCSDCWYLVDHERILADRPWRYVLLWLALVLVIAMLVVMFVGGS